MTDDDKQADWRSYASDAEIAEVEKANAERDALKAAADTAAARAARIYRTIYNRAYGRLRRARNKE
jgi:hypothetical protein